MCFIANRDPKRDYYLKALIETGSDIKSYGNYFAKTALYWRRPTSFFPKVKTEKMGSVYAKYSASLNIHAQVVRGGTNMRTFECAAYGIPQLVEYRNGLEEYLEPDKEILVFQDTDLSPSRTVRRGSGEACIIEATCLLRSVNNLGSGENPAWT